MLSSMTGKSATDYTLKRSSQAVTLAAKSSERIGSDTVQVDPQLLFQRLIVACNRSDDLQGLFRYELCCYLFYFELCLYTVKKFIRCTNSKALNV